jgi:hypothetical protein
MKKRVFTLCVDNYFPELCDITIPNHLAYADRIGADFTIIRERKYSEWHPTYEKVQIHDLGKDAEWNIHIDADVLISPCMWDVTSAEKSLVRWYSIYDPRLYFAPDKYSERDGRNIGVCSSFLAVPSNCHDIWEPFQKTCEEVLKGINQPHGVDDYCFTTNFAKYGLKGEFIFDSSHANVSDYLVHLGHGPIATEDHKKWMLEEADRVIHAWIRKEAAKSRFLGRAKRGNLLEGFKNK